MASLILKKNYLKLEFTHHFLISFNYFKPTCKLYVNSLAQKMDREPISVTLGPCDCESAVSFHHNSDVLLFIDYILEVQRQNKKEYGMYQRWYSISVLPDVTRRSVVQTIVLPGTTLVFLVLYTVVVLLQSQYPSNKHH